MYERSFSSGNRPVGRQDGAAKTDAVVLRPRAQLCGHVRPEIAGQQHFRPVNVIRADSRHIHWTRNVPTEYFRR